MRKKSVIANVCLQIGLASVAPAGTLACPPLLQVFAQMCIFFFNQVACFQEYLRVHSRRSLMPVPAPRRRRRPSSGGHHGHNTQPPAKEGAPRRHRRRGVQPPGPRPRSGQWRYGFREGARGFEHRRLPASTNGRSKRPQFSGLRERAGEGGRELADFGTTCWPPPPAACGLVVGSGWSWS